MGKLFRLGLTRPVKSVEPPVAPALKVVKSNGSELTPRPSAALRFVSFSRSTLDPSKPMQSLKSTNEPKSLRLSLFELSGSTCRWPQGDRPPFLYCGHLVDSASRYCPYHTGRALTPAGLAKRDQVFPPLSTMAR